MEKTSTGLGPRVHSFAPLASPLGAPPRLLTCADASGLPFAFLVSQKLVIEAVNKDIDMVDVVSPGQRPVVAEDELSNYVAALKDLWAEACVEDAIELANGECEVPLNTDEFDLSEVVAIYGMCVRDHCGIGGVCFWDSE